MRSLADLNHYRIGLDDHLIGAHPLRRRRLED
jgi:hypothetical protein